MRPSTSSPLLLVTRPEPAATETAAHLRAAGYNVLVSSALSAVAVEPKLLEIDKSSKLIVTSPQAARFLRNWTDLHGHKTIAVGARTADLLRAAGFRNVADAGGDAAAILAKTAKHMPRKYYLLGAPSTGRHLWASLWAQGHYAERVPVYRVAGVKRLSAGANEALKAGVVTHVLFYSARTAASFLAIAKNMNLTTVTALCMSQAVATVAATGHFRRIMVASSPTSEALQCLLPALD